MEWRTACCARNRKELRPEAQRCPGHGLPSGQNVYDLKNMFYIASHVEELDGARKQRLQLNVSTNRRGESRCKNVPPTDAVGWV